MVLGTEVVKLFIYGTQVVEVALYISTQVEAVISKYESK